MFEAGIGDGLIRGVRRGQVALASPNAQLYFTKIRSALKSAKLIRHEITASNTDELVQVRFFYSFNKQEILVEIGILTPEDICPGVIRAPIEISEDLPTEFICEAIAQKAREIGNVWKRDINGDPIPVEDVVLEQIRDILAPEIETANRRLVKQTNALMRSEDFRLEIQKACEDSVRDAIHGMLEPYMKLGPDALHRFVDELYCKAIHDE